MLNDLQINKKIIPYRPFHRAIDETVKIPEMAVSVSKFYWTIAVQLYQPTLIRWLSLLYVYKWTTVSVIHESLSISVRR